MNLSKEKSETFAEPTGAIGAVVGESTSTTVTVNTRLQLRVGEYVIIEPLNGEPILGWVEESIAKNEYVEDVVELEDAEMSDFLIRNYDFMMHQTKYYAKVKLLSLLRPLIEEGRQDPPRHAPDPLSPVYKANPDVLKMIFSKEDDMRYIRIGVLSAHEDVPFYINVNSIISRHLAIVAVTGAGKSNTVSVIVSRLVKEKNGTVLIFDMHGEYSDVLERPLVNLIEPKLDPTKLEPDAFAKLLNIKDAPKQELYLRNLLKAWKVLEMSGRFSKEEFYAAFQNMLIELISNKNSKLPIINDKYMEKLAEVIRNMDRIVKTKPLRIILEASIKLQKDCEEEPVSVIEPVASDRNSSLPSLLIKFQDMKSRYRSILDFYVPDIVEQIEKGKLNVLDLSSVDEEAADVIVSIAMKKILKARKDYVLGKKDSKLDVPIFLVLEEAHILAPQGRNTLTKYWVARITREGRKFGVGLCMVSQRPKGLDQDALSQANNLIVLRLIEPGDQRHVQASSEGLSEELVKQLPSLATGEALILGPLAPLPAIVRIDKAERKSVGRDIDAVEVWMEKREESKPDGDELWDE